MSQSRRPNLGPAPAWISSHPISYTDTRLDDDAEDGYSDLDYEQQVSIQENASYYKKTIRILTEAGVQNSSEISIDYDPSYQQLTFHSIRIIRESESINKLQLSKFKVLQQEKDRDRFIYDGTLTALLVLDDVRKGDIIEYSYTIRGANPIFKNRFCTDFRMQFGVPLYQLYYKLIVPDGRKITIQNLNSNLQPDKSQVKNATEYEWKQSNVSALRISDEESPSWYDVSPYVMVSEFANWNEVVDWGKELFPSVQLSSPLQLKVQEINSSTTMEEKISKALRFVQDDIRYLGIEMGENSHKPHSPNEVFSQRFGDCKDKSYLLCTMLKAMNIAACPVMINTTSKHIVESWLPSPYAFDHVITLVKLNEKEYFFDPTISYQRGNINDISLPDYEIGLVLADNSDGLSKINKRNYGKTTVFEQFDIDSKGNAKLSVKTIYTGNFADDIRYDFHTNSHYEILKRYKEFYKSYFEGIEADSLYTLDNQDGSFTTYETYTIPDFWNEKNKTKNISFEPYIIYTAIRRPKNTKSNCPFELKYPANIYEEIRITFPDEWNIEESEDKVETGAFRFSSKFTAVAKKVALLSYKYETLKESLPANELTDYVASLDKLDDATVFEVSFNNKDHSFSKSNSTSQSGSGFKYSELYVLLFICVGITYLVRRYKRTA